MKGNLGGVGMDFNTSHMLRHLSFSLTHKHALTHKSNKQLTSEAKMDPPIQLLNRLSAELAAAMIFNRMLCKARISIPLIC